MKLHRDLEITQKSAWHLMHRLRAAFNAGEMAVFSGPVEADETYIGGLEKNKHADNKHADKKPNAGRGGVGKAIVEGLSFVVYRNGVADPANLVAQLPVIEPQREDVPVPKVPELESVRNAISVDRVPNPDEFDSDIGIDPGRVIPALRAAQAIPYPGKQRREPPLLVFLLSVDRMASVCEFMQIVFRFELGIQPARVGSARQYANREAPQLKPKWKILSLLT